MVHKRRGLAKGAVCHEHGAVFCIFEIRQDLPDRRQQAHHRHVEDAARLAGIRLYNVFYIDAVKCIPMKDADRSQFATGILNGPLNRIRISSVNDPSSRVPRRTSKHGCALPPPAPVEKRNSALLQAVEPLAKADHERVEPGIGDQDVRAQA